MPRPLQRERGFYLGVDGGGTKTHAALIDEKGDIIGEGQAGPSNPLRVGVRQSAEVVRDAIERACAEAGVRRNDLDAIQIGLAGVRRADLRERVREVLLALHIHPLEIVTDADIALAGATGGEPGLVLVAGTGSICCGKNARGQTACAGGWGPLVGDEGSGAWLARRALQAVAHASDGRGPATSLARAACEYFSVATPDDLATTLSAPNMTTERIAGFGRPVVEAAQKKDAVAREIVAAAGRELGAAAIAFISQLGMERETFPVAYVGGVFKAGELVLGPLRETLNKRAPGASLAPPQQPPAVAAALMARAHSRRLALAG
ncbi:N-acetylglucosamine kinase [soil metagenome]